MRSWLGGRNSQPGDIEPREVSKMSMKETTTKTYNRLPEAVAMMPVMMTRSQAVEVCRVYESGQYATWLMPVFEAAYKKRDEHVCIAFEDYERCALAFADGLGMDAEQLPENLLFDAWCNEWHWQDVLAG